MGYADLDSLDDLYSRLDDPKQDARIEKLGTGKADADPAWHKARTRLKLCNVPWDQTYHDVVAWQSDEQRDTWFDALDGDIIMLNTAWNYKSLEIYKPSLGKYEGTVQVPVPYETAMGYNYLQVTMADQPVPQYGDWQRTHFHYHITGINKLSPNNTELTLELDAWTEYICSARITGVDLARGHWPMLQIDADQWLDNPIQSPVRMTEPEPDLPQAKQMIKGERFFPLYDDHPVIVCAMLSDLADPGSWWSDGKAHRDDRWWSDDNPGSDAFEDRMNVSRETFDPYPLSTDVRRVGMQDVDASSAGGHASPVTASGSSRTEGQTVTPLHYYAFASDAFGKFQSLLSNRYPQLVYGIKAVYVMPSRYLTLGDALTFDGISYREAHPDPAWQQLGSYDLHKDAFGYDTKWAGYAKMYSGQFASIDISDLQGHSISIGCEDLAGTLDVHARASSLWPFLSLQAFVDGIGGHGIKDYAIRPLQDMSVGMPQGLWEAASSRWDVPTYSLYADNRLSAAITYAQRRYSRDAINKNYQREMAAISVAKANGLNDLQSANADAVSSAKLGYDNALREATTARDTGLRSAGTVKGNAQRSAVTENANAVRSADTGLGVASRSADVQQVNAHRSASTAQANANASANTGYANASASAATTLTNANASAATSNADSNRTINTSQQNGEQNIDFTQQSTDRSIDYDKDMQDIALKYEQQTYAQQSTWLNERNHTQHIYGSTSIPLGSGFQMAAKAVRLYKATHAVNNDQSRVADASMGSVPKQATMDMMPDGDLGSDGGFAVGGSTPGGDTTALVAWSAQVAGQEAMANSQISNRFKWQHEEIDFASKQQRNQMHETVNKTVAFNQLQNDLTHDNNKSVLDRQTATQRQNTAADYQTATVNNGRSYDTAIANARRARDTSVSNAANEYNTTVANADRSHDASIANATDTRNATVANADRSRDTAVANANDQYDTSTSNLQAVYETSRTNQIKTRDRSLSSADMRLGVGTADLDNDLAQRRYAAEQARVMGNAQLDAQVASSYAGAPEEVAHATGSGDLDALGIRGLDIRLRRLSKGDERQVGQTFARYGYRMPPNTWIDDPRLDLRRHYTYWECRDAWIVTHRMSETARMFLTSILRQGTTVWSHPDEVKQTGLEY